ncbi:MAG: alpha/beta fold hydrolase [Sporichthyaceae bacterium]
MSETVPTVLIPGLACSARLYAHQIPELWRHGPVLVADHRGADSMAGLAAGILADAPPRFNLVGLSMGGYLSFEILRQAPERVARLALLDTTARPDAPEQTAKRHEQIAQARAGGLPQIVEALFPIWVAAGRRSDGELRALVQSMAAEVGADAFVRKLTAVMNRPDSRPDLATIACPTLVLVGEEDELTPLDRSQELVDALPDARLVAVADCGHLSAIEQPAAVSAALTWWLTA